MLSSHWSSFTDLACRTRHEQSLRTGRTSLELTDENLCARQDVVAGDGTTSVTVICGALLRKCLELLEKGVHPTVISDSFAKAAAKAEEILEGVAIPVDLGDRESLIKAANTCAAASLAPT